MGGAHLKVALAARGNEVLDVAQIPCPLWQGLDRLSEAIAEALMTPHLNGWATSSSRVRPARMSIGVLIGHPS